MVFRHCQSGDVYDPARLADGLRAALDTVRPLYLRHRWQRACSHADRRSGAPDKVAVYVISALSAGIAGIVQTGWLGAVTTNIGAGMELQVIAAAVIGGANLAGGAGTATGALIGAALIEVIRNSLGFLASTHSGREPLSAAPLFSRSCSTGCVTSGKPNNDSRAARQIGSVFGTRDAFTLAVIPNRHRR